MTVTEEIISRLDVLAEYRAWNVQFDREAPNSAGWVSCWAVDRERGDKPSAAVNVKSGRYKDKGGKGESLSLFEFAAKYGGFTDKDAAFVHFRTKTGVAGGVKIRRPDARLEFLEWSPLLVDVWATFYKPGVTAEAVQAFGGRLARYRDTYIVVALPIYSAALHKTEPIGWTLWNTSGGPLPSWPKKGQTEPTWVKMKTTAGSGNGLFCDPVSIAAAETVWKCEGPADALALWSAIPAGERPKHAVIANSSGSGEPPTEPIVSLLAGKNAFVIGDCDVPGQEGAKTWAGAIARHAATARTIALPYEVVPNHGRDLRDYLTSGHGFEDLLGLAPKAEPIAATALRSLDKIDDPHSLAEAFLDARCTQDGTRTLRFHQQEWRRWIRGAYLKVPDAELRAELTRFVRQVFVAANIAELRAPKADGPPPETRKVGRALVGDVANAIQGEVCVSSRTKAPAWLDRPDSWDPADCFVFPNAIVNLRHYAESPEVPYVRPPDPRFFSLVATNYDYQRTLEAPALWLKCLGEWFDDPLERLLLQQIMGYFLLPITNFHKLFMFIGPTRAGKGVVQDVVADILGRENVAAMDIHGLTDPFGMQPLYGKLVCTFGDMRTDGRTDIARLVSKLLSISGEDPQSINRKFLEPFTAKITARLLVATNETPMLTDASGALMGRLVMLIFKRSFYGKEDRELREKLRPELPQIFQWCAEGLFHLWRTGEFVEPASSRRAREEMFKIVSPVGHFAQEKCTIDPHASVQCEVLWNAWNDHCKEENRNPGTQARFGRDLLAKFHTVQRVRRQELGQRVYHYQGIGLGRSDGPIDAEERLEQAQRTFHDL